MTAIVIVKPGTDQGCDLCPFPTRFMAKVRIINPFGSQHLTDFGACWACFEHWVEDSDHGPLTAAHGERPKPPPPVLHYQGPFAIAGNYWRRTEGDD